MMAFERHEPFGALAEEFRAGQIAAVIANVNRGKDTEPLVASDFMPALHMAFERVKPPAQMLEDPEAQSALLDAILFGKAADD